MKLKERLKKIKIRQRLVNLKEKIKQRPLKYVIPIVILVISGSPLYSYAEEITGADKGTCPNPKGPKSKLDQYRELGISIIGLKKCLDPRSTPLRKALYCSRPCCIVAGLTSGFIVEKSAIDTPLHKAAAVCCALSWSTYGVLLFFDQDKTKIKQ